MNRCAGLSLVVRLALGGMLGLATLACTTRTIVHQAASDAGVLPDDTAGGDAVEDDDATGEDVPGAPAGADAGADAGKKPPPGPADTDEDAGPVLVGGAITLGCPQSGFHAGPPIRIASLPSNLLPRCTAATRSCAYAAQTSAAYDACLAADTMPTVVHDGEIVDCTACDRTQGAFCLASACRSTFATYGCCAQARGEAACVAERDAMLSCARTTGKAAFESCVASVVGGCFAR